MPKGFVNRTRELAALEQWWASGSPLGLVWGRRRIGKTWLLRQFAESKVAVAHTGGERALPGELSIVSAAIRASGLEGRRDLGARPFTNWDDALDGLAAAADRSPTPVLFVLDEFPELLKSEPALESVLRAWGERAAGSNLRVLLSGTATRVMRRMQEERAPLYGRFGLRLQVHPFEPHEAALMLRRLDPATRALVWGVVGGVPLYLSWWDQDASVRRNIEQLFCTPAARLLTEGQLLLATEGDEGALAGRIMSAVAGGRTKFNEIKDAVRTDPTRSLERLIEMRLLERMVPVTEDPAASRRALYRIGDNFLAFWLSVVDRYRTEIEQGLGPSILSVLLASLDDHMGPRWEEAFRDHLRRSAAGGALTPDIVAVGRFWQADLELDAVALAGRGRRPVLVGEAKWAERLDARPVEADLYRRAGALADDVTGIRLAVCARREVRNASPDTLVVTADDIFG